MGPRPRHWNWRLSRRWIWLWCTNVTAWNLIKDLLILGEKWRGRATLAHNTRLGNSLPDWSLGFTKIPRLDAPRLTPRSFLCTEQNQVQETLDFMEQVLSTEANLGERVPAIHTETMTHCLDTDEDRRMFPLLRNCTAKMAHSQAVTYGKCIFDEIATRQILGIW